MGLQGKSLYVLTPMYGGTLSLNYHNSFVQLVNLCHQLNIEIGWSNTWNESLISRARNRMTDSFLKQSENTHCVFIDADIGFDPRDIMMMLEMDKDILGVPCTTKKIRWDRVQDAVSRRAIEWAHMSPECKNGASVDSLLKLFKESGRQINIDDFPKVAGNFVLNFPPKEGQITFQLDKPEPMKHVGTGLLMVKREVFLKFKKAYPDRWYESRGDEAVLPGKVHDFFRVGINPETREYDSEDYWFIHDCIAIGYQALLLFHVRTTHMGTYTYESDVPAAVALSGTIF